MQVVKFPRRRMRTLDQQLADIANKMRERDGPVAAYHKVASLAEVMRKEIAPKGV